MAENLQARATMEIVDRVLSRECIEAALGAPARGVGIVVLGQRRLDRMLARASPAFPLAFFGPAVVLLLVAAHRPGSLALHGASFLAGALLWTLTEYLLHRFVFHLALVPTRNRQIAAFLMHGYHHAYPRDATRLVLPPLVSVPIALVLFFLAHVVLGGGAVDAGFAGFLAGYIAYDSLHYVTHHTRRTIGVIGWLRRYHLLHHHQGVEARYGVSSPLWDLVFGTYRDPRSRGAAPPG